MSEDKKMKAVMVYLSEEDRKRLAVLKEEMEKTSASETVRELIREGYKRLIKEA